ncbi:hypothetical protein C9J21_18340 [Photobacterium phosphoreum]|uniref:hypothetical protein n=1 Tax=Photobacterium phosphoreum TaxID=659 RepID=UPI000D15D9CD|nr:hypothetical protein [Photobacterium phosphoreum]PSW30847.1 hypothetical protein C9J21_18340 [Photobacterium phosphoreum]
MTYKFTLNKEKPVEHIIKTFGSIPLVPNYNLIEQAVGKWQINTFDCGLTSGYWSAESNQCCRKGHKSLALSRDGTVVMSLTPMELESHLIPYNEAKGNVVIAGLGLAMITINLLSKRTVKKITVLEIDDTVISLYPEILADKDKQLWIDNIDSGRLQIIKQDCTQIIPNDIKTKIGRVDYMWVDTWDVIGSDSSLPITQYLQNELKATTVDFWSMEFFWISELIKDPLFKQNPLKSFRQWIDTTGLPLSVKNMSTHKQRMLLDLSIITASICYNLKKNN